jgi:uncharacterized membrane protein HdeD (DUF308 family)
MLSAAAPGGMKGSILLVILGIIGFFFGIATILSPYVMGQAIFILAGIALLIGGVLGLVLAISEKQMTHRGCSQFKVSCQLYWVALSLPDPLSVLHCSSFSWEHTSLIGELSAS